MRQTKCTLDLNEKKVIPPTCVFSKNKGRTCVVSQGTLSILTTSKYLTGTRKLGFFLALVMTDDDRTCPAHSMSIRGWSTDVNWIRFRSRTPQKSTWNAGGGGGMGVVSFLLTYTHVYSYTSTHTYLQYTHRYIEDTYITTYIHTYIHTYIGLHVHRTTYKHR